MSYTSLSDWNQCTECGDCLVLCPVMEMERDEATAAISGLLHHGRSERVFDECTFCFRCNNFCPQGLRPHELILEKFLAARKEKGAMSAVYPYLFNGMETSLWKDLYARLTQNEQSILKKWSEMPPPSREILWVGCIGRLSCVDIENSEIMRDLPKYGPPELCCGELAYRLGSWKAYVRTIEKTLKAFEKLKTETMVCYCGSCYNYLSNILPRVYGRKLPFRLISLYEWLDEKRKAGALRLQKPLSLKTALHESCYVSELGQGFAGSLRDLYASTGAKILDLPHNGERNLSCGAVSVLRTLYMPSSLFKEQNRKYREVRQTGVRDLAVNCPGCYITLSLTSRFKGIKLHYIPEEVLQAYGDRITRPLSSRIQLFVRSFLRRFTLPLKRVDPEASPAPAVGED